MVEDRTSVFPDAPEREGYRLAFEDRFDTGTLDTGKWLPAYLPHWSTLERTRPRYNIADGGLVLRIDPDQQPWCPEFDGAISVSALQTGHFSGPVGSIAGQHRWRSGLVVREQHSAQKLYVPRHGYFELRAKAAIGPGDLVALFMLGFEEEPEKSGEITIMEIFGDNIGADGTKLGHGIKHINDPTLRDEFFEDELPFNVSDFHVYSAEWTPDGVSFYFDKRLLHHVEQSPRYPMQFMLTLYALRPSRARNASFTIDYFRGYEKQSVVQARTQLVSSRNEP